MRRISIAVLLAVVAASSFTHVPDWGVAAQASSVLDAPQNLTAAVNGDAVALQWSGVDGATSYVIEAGSLPGLADLAVFDTASIATSVAVTRVPPRNYWVRVRAHSGSLTSDASNEVLVSVAGGQCLDTLYPPSGWRTSGLGTSVTLTWDAPTIGCLPTEYIIEAGSAPGTSDLVNARTGSAATSITATDVPPGAYYVRIRSVDDHTVSVPAEERIVVVATGSCVYSVSPRSISISRGGMSLPGSISVQADEGCPWTIASDAVWLTAPFATLPVSGSGSQSVPVSVNVNLGPPRSATIEVRWPGGGVDVVVSQDGFGF